MSNDQKWPKGKSCNNSDRDLGHRLAMAQGGLYFFRSLIWDLYLSGQYSDFTIRVKGSAREFRVHRAVLCPQSKIFEAACRGDFIEASSNSITLSDDDPEIVERMINYLYSHRYDDEEDYDHDCLPSEVDGKAVIEGQHGVGEEQPSSPSSSSPSPSSSRDLTSTPSPLSITSSTTIDTCTTAQTARAKDSTAVPNSLRVYALADKYLISPLKELARIRFTKWVAHHWSSPRFVAAVREIFDGESGNYAELHEAVMTPLVLHADHLLCFDPDEVENVLASSMNQLLHDYTDISVEILRRVLERNRISQRGLEVDVAELHSRVDALRSENRKIALLQSQNQRLTKELLELQMTRIGWRRGSGASGGNNAHTITSTDVARRVGNRRTAAMTGNGRLS